MFPNKRSHHKREQGRTGARSSRSEIPSAAERKLTAGTLVLCAARSFQRIKSNFLTFSLVALFFVLLLYHRYRSGNTQQLYHADTNADSSKIQPALTSTKEYAPAPVETYILNHMKELGLDKRPPDELVETCHIWRNASAIPHHADLMIFQKELQLYYKKIESLDLGVPDIRKILAGGTENVCEQLELHSKGLSALFSQSQQLSYTPQAGWIEPLLPPMRNPLFCLQGGESEILNVQYLIHDFAAMCRQLKPTSKTVFVDIGASLSFHPGQESPVILLLNLFRKFGILFDHIYAYEATLQHPSDVFSQIPEHFQASYHWINVGVESNPTSPHNPFKVLLDNFEEDDLIIVKLDIDQSILERELVDQLLTNSKLAKLIDHFYFEHHVNQLELAGHWGYPQRESVQESFRIFHLLRERGVAAHFWV